MDTMKPRLMEPRDEPHVLTMAANALSSPGERLAMLGRYRAPMWVPSAAPPGMPREIEGFPRALNDGEKEALAKVGIGVTVGGVWLDADALKTVAALRSDRKMTPEDEPHVAALVEKHLGLRQGTVFFDGVTRVPKWKGMAGDAAASGPLTDWETAQVLKLGISIIATDEDCAVWLSPAGQALVKRDTYPGPTRIGVEAGERPLVPPELGVAQHPQRFAEAMKEIAKPTLSALEAQREREEQQALAMIRERRAPGESEPETLQRLLSEEARFYPALDDDTPEILRRCSGKTMFEAAAQFAHYIVFEVPKLKLKAPGAPSAPQADWLRSACTRTNPTYQGDLIDWVMDTLRKLAAEREHLQGVLTIREGCATAWGEACDLLNPLAEELDDNLGHEGPLDVLRRVLAQRAEAEEHDLEALPRIDVEGPHEHVFVAADKVPMTLETARDVVRFLNARLSGLDFDSCEEIAVHIERMTKEWRDMKAELTELRSRAPGAYHWENDGSHRLFHDGTGALCYEGPGVKRLINNRAHPHPGKAPVHFSEYALALVAQIVNIARDAAREKWLSLPASHERQLVANILASLRTGVETPPSTLGRVLRERAQAQSLNREMRAQLDTIEQGHDRVELGAALRMHGVTSGDLLPAAARKLRELASPFIPTGQGAKNPFIASLAGKSMAGMVTALAGRVLDTDASADALGRLYPEHAVSFAGLADVAASEIRKRRAERAETEATLGSIADTMGLSRQAPGQVIAREVRQMRTALEAAVAVGQRFLATGRNGAATGNAPAPVGVGEVKVYIDPACTTGAPPAPDAKPAP